MTHFRNPLPWLVAAILLVGGSAWLYVARVGANGEFIVRRQDLVVTIDVKGSLEAVHSVQLGPPQIPDAWNFTIQSMAPEGKEVNRGEVVLTFDASDFRRRLQDQQAKSEQAAKEFEKRQHELDVAAEDNRLAIANAEAELRKSDLKTDVPVGLIADRDLEIARLDRQIAQQKVSALRAKSESSRRAAAAELAALAQVRDQAAARVDRLRESINQMQVKAPRDGTVIYLDRPSRDGNEEKFKTGDQVWRAFKVLEIPDLSKMRGDGMIDEVDVGRVQVGQSVQLRLDAHSEKEYSGTVDEIRGTVGRESETSPRKVVRVRIALDKTDSETMRPGMRFRGTIEVKRLHDVFVVPLTAVTPTPTGPQVRRRQRLGWAAAPVELGERNDRWVEVRSGLNSADEVAYSTAMEEGETGE